MTHEEIEYTLKGEWEKIKPVYRISLILGCDLEDIERVFYRGAISSLLVAKQTILENCHCNKEMFDQLENLYQEASVWFL